MTHNLLKASHPQSGLWVKKLITGEHVCHPSLSHGCFLWIIRLVQGWAWWREKRERRANCCGSSVLWGIVSADPAVSEVKLLSPLISWVKEEGPRVALSLQKSSLTGAEENRKRAFWPLFLFLNFPLLFLISCWSVFVFAVWWRVGESSRVWMILTKQHASPRTRAYTEITAPHPLSPVHPSL